MKGRHFDEFPAQLARAGMAHAVVCSADSWGAAALYHLAPSPDGGPPLCGATPARQYVGALRTLDVDPAECGYQICQPCRAASAQPLQLSLL